MGSRLFRSLLGWIWELDVVERAERSERERGKACEDR